MHIAVQEEQSVHIVRRQGCLSFLQQASHRTENPLAITANEAEHLSRDVQQRASSEEVT
jgi:hypothetical protein